MERCKECNRKALWICYCTNILLCAEHKRTHLDLDIDHNITKLRILVDQPTKLQASQSLISNLSLLSQCEQEIISSTHALVSVLSTQSADSLHRLSLQRKSYQQALQSLSQEISEDEFKKLEHLTARILRHNSFSLDPIASSLREYYQQDFFSDSLISQDLSQAKDMLIRDYSLYIEGHLGGAKAMALTRDNSLVVSASFDKTIRIWSLQTRHQLSILRGHSEVVNSLVLSSDDTKIISCSSDTTIRVWSLPERRQLSLLRGHSLWVNSVAITSDDKYIISGSNDTSVRIWDLEALQEVAVLKGHTGYVTAVAVTSNSEVIVSGSRDNTLRIWSFLSKAVEAVLEGHSTFIFSLAITGDDQFVFSGGNDGTVKVWDIGGRKEISSLTGHTSTVNCIAGRTGSWWIATGSNDGTVRIWEVSGGVWSDRIVKKYLGIVNCFAFTDDGRVVIGSSFRALRTLSLADEKIEIEFCGHYQEVKNIVMFGSNRYAISSSDDKTVRIWNLESKRQEVCFNNRQEASEWINKFNEIEAFFT